MHGRRRLVRASRPVVWLQVAIPVKLKGIVAAFTGNRAGGYEKKLLEARKAALGQMQSQAAELGANAVVGVDVDYEFIDTVLMISASGTAVIVR